MVIRLGSFELNVSASGVNNDPLYELIEAGIFVLNGESGFYRVSIWLEPAGYAIDIFSSINETMQVRVSWGKSYTPPAAKPRLTTKHGCNVSRSVFAYALFSGLSNFFASVSASWKEDWCVHTDRYEEKMNRFADALSSKYPDGAISAE